MIALVTGGAASGKSAWAEDLACRLSPARTYVATMTTHGQEAQARIAKHRAQRQAGGFITRECTGTLVCPPSSAEAAAGVALVDDVGNLVSCALFPDGAPMADAQATLKRLDAEFVELACQYAHVVVVGNDVGESGEVFADESATWVRLVGSLCCRIAAHSDAVFEVVAGQARCLKGAEQWH